MRLIFKDLVEGGHFILDNFTVKKTEGLIYIAEDSNNEFKLMKKTEVGGKKVHAIPDGYRIYIIR